MTKTPYIFLSAALSLIVTDQTYQFLEVIARETIQGVQYAPYQYRLLFSYLWYPLQQLTGAHIAAFLFWFITFAMLAFFIDEIGQATGHGRNTQTYLLAAYVIIPALIYFHPAPAFGNAIEAVFIAAALLAILRGRPLWLYPLVIAATLNRETAFLIPLMAAVTLRSWKHTALLFIAWAVTYGVIRLAIGPVPSHVTLAEIHAKNLGYGMFRFVLGLFFVAWLFWYAFKGWKAAPPPLRRAAYIVPVYLALVAVFGVWYEWRLMLTIYPVLIPLAGFVEVVG